MLYNTVLIIFTTKGMESELVNKTVCDCKMYTNVAFVMSLENRLYYAVAS